MTREEALLAMQNGSKITHIYFSPDEYLYMLNEAVLTEDGHVFSLFFDKSKEHYNEGWSIKE